MKSNEGFRRRRSRGGLWLAALAAVLAQTAWAQGGESSGNPFLKGLVIVLGLVAVWLLLYKLLYPYLLNFYSPVVSKALFWPLFLLYALTWLHLAAGYWLFDLGYVLAYWWLRPAAAFLAFMFLVWFVIAMARRA